MTTRISIFVLLQVLALALACRDKSASFYSEGAQRNAIAHPAEPSDALSRILRSPSISPHQLEAYTNQHDGNETDFVDYRPIWKRLEISTGQDGLFDGFDPSSTRWEAELIDVSSQLEPVRIVAKLSVNGGADRRYLIFAKEESESSVERWRCAGSIDITDNYEASEATHYHCILSDSKHVWLVLRTAPRIGTGVSSSDERWYLIDREPPREVLKYPVQGGRVMGALSDLEYQATNTEPKVIDGRLTATVRYKVSFGVEPKPQFHWLFARTAHVTFRWDQNEDKFVVDRSTSDVPEAELNTSFGSADEAKFIEYNLREFIRSARGVGAERQTWLKRISEKVPDGSQKAALIQALRR